MFEQAFKNIDDVLRKEARCTRIGDRIYDGAVSSACFLGQQRNTVLILDFLRKETQRLEAIYREKLATLDELKKSLLHQAFSGEL